jgi:hypothetical protein
VLLAMVPLNVVLLAWAWFGRVAFGVGGWFLLILVPAVALLLIGLVVTTVLAMTQPGSPKALTAPQAAAQLAVWLGLFGFGLFLPDFGDTEESQTSFLTQVFGRSDALFELSMAVALAFGVLVVVAYLVLLVLLIGARRRG